MTKIDRTREWTNQGRRLGYRQHISPWGHGICWATVDLNTGEVLATESAYDFGDGVQFTAAASCTPHMLVVPDSIVLAEKAAIEELSKPTCPNDVGIAKYIDPDPDKTEGKGNKL